MYMTKEEEVLRIQNKVEAKDDLIYSLQIKNFEALRSNQTLDQNLGRPTTSVETVCVVDIRDNIPQDNTLRNDKVVTKQKGKVMQK